jgi:hypothetical protein
MKIVDVICLTLVAAYLIAFAAWTLEAHSSLSRGNTNITPTSAAERQ